MHLLHHQPFKSLYLVCIGAILLSKIPWILVSCIPRSGRGWRAWTYKRAVIIKLMRALPSGIGEKVKLRFRRDLTKEPPNSSLRDAEFNWIQPLPSTLITGEIRRLADINNILPVKIPGYWLFKANWKPSQVEQKAEHDEKTVIHFHGGAYYIGSAHPSDICCNITRGLLKHSHSLNRTFGVDYRLAATKPFKPENHIPAQILDAAAGYAHVLSLGFKPSNITIAGDSAGGNLVLALVRYLRDANIPTLPLPGSIALFSAWGDASESREGPDASNYRNAPTDIFGEDPGEKTAEWGTLAYLGNLPWSETEHNPYISPASAHIKSTEGLFSTFPKTFICAGNLEVLLDHSIAIRDRMIADGCDVTISIPEQAVHDYVVFRWHEPERTTDLKAVAKWIDDI